MWLKRLKLKYLNDEEWKKQAQDIAHNIVMTVEWPWTEREKRLWFIGVLADFYTREYLEKATIEQLQKAHDEITH